MVRAHACSTLLAVPFSRLDSTVPLPDKRPFPAELQSVGDHIKYARLSRRILIKDVVALLQISRETLRGWELGEFEPQVSHFPLIISFLGYSPFRFDTTTLAGKIKEYRYRKGLTQKELGELLSTDTSIIWQWETNGRIPIEKTQKQILELIEKGE